MAERRMFSKKVTEDDEFLLLSASAQALYLHLMMSADDDGFSNQVTLSMFRAHASVQDLQSLLERRYLYQFDHGVVVVTHWRLCNLLRKDRYKETDFKKEMSMLGLDENGKYVLISESEQNEKELKERLPSGCQMVAETATNGCQPVAERLPQYSIGKYSIDYNNIYSQVPTEKTADFAQEAKEVIDFFNQKTGKHFRSSGANQKLIASRLKEGYTVDDLKKIIETKTKDWLNDPSMNKYLKPETLFRPSHVDGYLNEQEVQRVPDQKRPQQRNGSYFVQHGSAMSYDEYEATGIEIDDE